jgi:hypothetical protein
MEEKKLDHPDLDYKASVSNTKQFDVAVLPTFVVWRVSSVLQQMKQATSNFFQIFPYLSFMIV